MSTATATKAVAVDGKTDMVDIEDVRDCPTEPIYGSLFLRWDHLFASAGLPQHNGKLLNDYRLEGGRFGDPSI